MSSGKMSRQLCRLCLGKTELVSIFELQMEDEDNLQDMVQITCGVLISPLDQITHMICRTCHQIAKRMFLFRTTAIKNDSLLKARNRTDPTPSKQVSDNRSECLSENDWDNFDLQIESPKASDSDYKHHSLKAILEKCPNLFLPSNINTKANFNPCITLLTNEVEDYFKKRSVEKRGKKRSQIAESSKQAVKKSRSSSEVTKPKTTNGHIDDKVGSSELGKPKTNPTFKEIFQNQYCRKHTSKIRPHSLNNYFSKKPSTSLKKTTNFDPAPTSNILQQMLTEGTPPTTENTKEQNSESEINKDKSEETTLQSNQKVPPIRVSVANTPRIISSYTFAPDNRQINHEDLSNDSINGSPVTHLTNSESRQIYNASVESVLKSLCESFSEVENENNSLAADSKQKSTDKKDSPSSNNVLVEETSSDAPAAEAFIISDDSNQTVTSMESANNEMSIEKRDFCNSLLLAPTTSAQDGALLREIEQPLSRINKSQPLFMCTICNTAYESRQKLKVHKRKTHTKCPFCNTKFKTIEIKAQHLIDCNRRLIQKAKNVKLVLTKAENDPHLRGKYSKAFDDFFNKDQPSQQDSLHITDDNIKVNLPLSLPITESRIGAELQSAQHSNVDGVQASDVDTDASASLQNQIENKENGVSLQSADQINIANNEVETKKGPQPCKVPMVTSAPIINPNSVLSNTENGNNLASGRTPEDAAICISDDEDEENPSSIRMNNNRFSTKAGGRCTEIIKSLLNDIYLKKTQVSVGQSLLSIQRTQSAKHLVLKNYKKQLLQKNIPVNISFQSEITVQQIFSNSQTTTVTKKVNDRKFNSLPPNYLKPITKQLTMPATMVNKNIAQKVTTANQIPVIQINNQNLNYGPIPNYTPRTVPDNSPKINNYIFLPPMFAPQAQMNFMSIPQNPSTSVVTSVATTTYENNAYVTSKPVETNQRSAIKIRVKNINELS